ncbi:MAG: class I tRNA ligase family protein, partial [Acidimicrobiia bacterium]|nr:class I tRNA ligase family protein [Acidimicrobiia bacterium]
VGYALDADGHPQYDHPLLHTEDQLPIDPSTDVPEGYTADQRGVPGGFVGDPDVFDTWATSSLSPQIAGMWEDDPDLFERVFPMDMRPQGHDIIRTWLFSTVVRSHHEFGCAPWAHAALSGWILDPDRKKMSKSKGNVVTPVHLIESYGADAVRYWAASGRPGTDTAFDEGQMKIGRRLSIKLLNASRFVLRIGATDDAPEAPVPGGPIVVENITEPIDRALCHQLATLVNDATAAFETYDYARALERTETFFWRFCDDYLELVKQRAYGEHDDVGTASARATLELSLSTLLRLFAPFLPFVTEEVWSWWMEGSVHQAPWPDAGPLRAAAGDVDPTVLDVAGAVLGEIRKAKTSAKRSLRTPVELVTITDVAPRLAAVSATQRDLSDAGSVLTWDLAEASGPDDATVAVELTPDEP